MEVDLLSLDDDAEYHLKPNNNRARILRQLRNLDEKIS